MEPRELTRVCVNKLMELGADAAQVSLSDSKKHELNVEAGAINLLRTTYDTGIRLTAHVDKRKASTSLNKTDAEAIDAAARQVVDDARSSEQDEANAIAEYQPPKEFSRGPLAPDLDAMYERLDAFLRHAKTAYPDTILEQVILDHAGGLRVFQNSNGVDYCSNDGAYHCMLMFTTRRGGKSSSFNVAGFSAGELDRDLTDYAGVDRLLRESVEQVETEAVRGKFTGDLIMTPEALDDLLAFVARSLSDGAMISGTSLFKDKLHEEIASPLLTLRSTPRNDQLAEGYAITRDGYEALDATIIHRGTLQSFLLSLYGARKTGKPMAVNNGGCYVVDPGETSLEDGIRRVERGVLMVRFSGGNPAENGDFSGVAKNSYYVEDGAVRHPIRETMLSGNLADVLRSVRWVSRERVNFGTSLLPWVCASGVTVSGAAAE
jgi:PmbA protein